ncbi:MAG: glycosyltransferase family 4 protein [Candidatus Levybacteria bacterium]|nr:glycosyltransferase family 4 protein [Candidatus Levybacteria bacterium]
MKILLASVLKRRVAEDVSASRSRIIYQLASGLVKKGHEVSLLGTGDSEIEGVEIIPIIPNSFVDLPKAENPFYAETSHLVRMSRKIEEIGNDFDIIHNHTYPEFINLMAISGTKTPMVTTVHAQATPELDDVLSAFPEAKLISISKAHMSEFKKAKFIKCVYNGVDTNTYAYHEGSEDYMLWLGRLSKAKKDDGSFLDPKGVGWAIKLAKATGQKLLISGSVEDKEFYDKEIKPNLGENIRWYGPVSPEQSLERSEVIKIMQRAKVFLMTINWNEPFGLVMAEAMSSGTPVIGFNRGAVSEVIKEGITGFVVDPEKGVDGLTEALNKLDSIKPADCRQHILDNFSIENMVNNYEAVYKEVTNL